MKIGIVCSLGRGTRLAPREKKPKELVCTYFLALNCGKGHYWVCVVYFQTRGNM